MTGKYLITTDQWFVAPNGQSYKAVWGNVEILEDNTLGIKTNRNSSNWFVKIGSECNHVIVAGCQIHYACKSDKIPNTSPVKDWQLDASNYNEAETPCKIYIAD